MIRLRNIPPRIWACLSLGAAWLVFFAPAIFSTDVLFERDLLMTEIPLRHYARERLLSGELPLWYLGEMLGVPFAGTVIASVFHPRTLLLFLLSPSVATKWSLLLAYLFGLIGGYRLARVFGASRLGAVTGAIAFAFSGCAISYNNKANMLLGLVAAPWMLAAVWRITQRERWKDVASLGACWALVFIGGDPQLFLELAVVAGGLFLAGRPRWRVLGRLVLGGVLAVLVASAELLPSLGLESDSIRAYWKPTAMLARMWALHPVRLAELVLPGFFPTDDIRMQMGKLLETRSELFVEWVFVGGIVVALAVMGAIQRKPARWVWIGTVVLGFWLALGSHGGLIELWWKALPFFAKFRYPEKYVGVAMVALVPLVARGVDSASQRAAPVIAGVGAVVVFFAIGLPGDTLVSAALGVTEPQLASAWSIGLGWLGGGLLVLGGVLWLRQSERRMKWALPVLVFFELWHANAHHMPLVSKDRAEEYGPIAESLAAQRLPGEPPPRVMPAWIGLNEKHRPPEEQVRLAHLSLDADDGARAGISTMEANAPGEGWRIIRIFSTLPDAETWYRRFDTCFRVASDEHPPAVEEQPITRAFEDGMMLMRRPCLPRVYLARAQPVDTAEEAKAQMKAGLDDDLVVWEGGPPLGNSNGSVRTLAWQPEHLAFDVETTAPSALVVADAFARGWSATVDGAGTPIYPTDGAVRGVAVPAGHHHVEMSYRAPGQTSGIALSCIGLLVCLGLAFTDRRLQAH